MVCDDLLSLGFDAETPCVGETQTVSKFSPGVVGNEETVARQVYTPIHVNAETGEILPTLFSDVKDKGMSVNRLSHASEQQVADMGYAKQDRDRANGNDRTYQGFVQASASAIRALNDGQPLFCIFDTAREDDVSHADVCQRYAGRSGRQLKKLRKRLFEVFSMTPVKLPKDR